MTLTHTTWHRGSRVVMILFYLLGGINHFVNPGFYLLLIPGYLPWPDLLNILSGIFEVGLALALILPRTRRLAAWGIIAMLVAFIPAHIHLIQIGGCVAEGLCIPLWVVWARLVVIHPLLMAWAWSVR
ncbi:MAG: DoxX family protein [Bacteroidia bacterium]